jgi:hypothetical protein
MARLTRSKSARSCSRTLVRSIEALAYFHRLPSEAPVLVTADKQRDVAMIAASDDFVVIRAAYHGLRASGLAELASQYLTPDRPETACTCIG